MESYLRFSIIVLLCGLCVPAIAAQPGNTAQTDAVGAAEANALNLPAFPFLAEITGDDGVVERFLFHQFLVSN